MHSRNVVRFQTKYLHFQLNFELKEAHWSFQTFRGIGIFMLFDINVDSKF